MFGILKKSGKRKQPKPFGTAIAVLNEYDNVPVPTFVQECVRFIEKSESIRGIFLKDECKPYNTQVQAMRKQIEKMQTGSLSSVIPNVHVAAGLIKVFLANLPDPVVTSAFSQGFLEVAAKYQTQQEKEKDNKDNSSGSKDSKGKGKQEAPAAEPFDFTESYLLLQHFVGQLPEANRFLLTYLLAFFQRLLERETNSSKKASTVKKLRQSIIDVFAPLLFKLTPGNAKAQEQSSQAVTVWQLLLDSFHLHHPERKQQKEKKASSGAEGGKGKSPDLSSSSDAEKKDASDASNSAASPAGKNENAADDSDDDEESEEEFSNMIPVRVTNLLVTNIVPGTKVKSVRALYQFDARKDTEISMARGDIILITYQDDQPGWWEGKIESKTGLFPSNYCEVYEIWKPRPRKLKTVDASKVSSKIALLQTQAFLESGGGSGSSTPTAEEEALIKAAEEYDRQREERRKAREERKKQKAAANANASSSSATPATPAAAAATTPAASSSTPSVSSSADDSDDDDDDEEGDEEIEVPDLDGGVIPANVPFRKYLEDWEQQKREFSASQMKHPTPQLKKGNCKAREVARLYQHTLAVAQQFLRDDLHTAQLQELASAGQGAQREMVVFSLDDDDSNEDNSANNSDGESTGGDTEDESFVLSKKGQNKKQKKADLNLEIPTGEGEDPTAESLTPRTAKRLSIFGKLRAGLSPRTGSAGLSASGSAVEKGGISASTSSPSISSMAGNLSPRSDKKKSSGGLTDSAEAPAALSKKDDKKDETNKKKDDTKKKEDGKAKKEGEGSKKDSKSKDNKTKDDGKKIPELVQVGSTISLEVPVQEEDNSNKKEEDKKEEKKEEPEAAAAPAPVPAAAAAEKKEDKNEEKKEEKKEEPVSDKTPASPAPSSSSSSSSSSSTSPVSASTSSPLSSHVQVTTKQQRESSHLSPIASRRERGMSSPAVPVGLSKQTASGNSGNSGNSNKESAGTPPAQRSVSGSSPASAAVVKNQSPSPSPAASASTPATASGLKNVANAASSTTNNNATTPAPAAAETVSPSASTELPAHDPNELVEVEAEVYVQLTQLQQAIDNQRRQNMRNHDELNIVNEDVLRAVADLENQCKRREEIMQRKQALTVM